jgi:2-keto-3-deoxygluconate permease
MKILATIKKVPGGLIVIPMLFVTLINTFVPQVLLIGGISTATFSAGTLAFIGMNLFCVGAQINPRGVLESLKRGAVLVVATFLAGFIPTLLLIYFFGDEGVMGITPLMIMACVTSINCGIYLGLMETIGDKYDLGAQSLLSLSTGPFFALIGLGAAGVASFDVVALIASVGTMVVGFILGNLDEEIRKFLGSGVMFTLPFIGFCLGSHLNLMDIANGGMVGVILGLLTMVLSFIFLVPADKFILRRPGYAAVANCSSAGSAVAVPAIVAGVSPNLLSQVSAATTAIAASAIITAFLCPVLTSIAMKKWGWVNKTSIETDPKGAEPITPCN